MRGILASVEDFLGTWINSLGGDGYSSVMSSEPDCSSPGARVEVKSPYSSGWSLFQIKSKKIFWDPKGWDNFRSDLQKIDKQHEGWEEKSYLEEKSNCE